MKPRSAPAGNALPPPEASSRPSLIETSLLLRPDLVGAVARAWEHIAAPGIAWSRGERVAIAAEARQATSCRLCRERGQALTAYQVDGTHTSIGALPVAAVDAVHRIVTDPARLTERWYLRMLESGLSAAQYVELVGVVAALVAVDTLARLLGSPPPPLPAPRLGAPSAHIEDAAGRHTSWVPTVPPDAAEGKLLDLYRNHLTNGWGLIPNIQRALTLVPEEQEMLSFLQEGMYVPLTAMGGSGGGRALLPTQIELVAATVSAANGCFY